MIIVGYRSGASIIPVSGRADCMLHACFSYIGLYRP